MEENTDVLMSIEENKKILNAICREIDGDQEESEMIRKRMKEIEKRFVEIDENVAVMSHKKECLDVLLIEIDKGYEKILASSQCLTVLANRKLRMLKRKYSKYI